jgi:predicted dehydrogenase
MRFAILGNHPDGVALARALAETGRHEVLGQEAVGQGITAAPRRAVDLEEVLANPAVEAVIVAGAPAVRAQQLRRALQSERHALCVHPVDGSPEVAYEAAMLEKDVGRVLFPILPEALHPAVARLASFVEREGSSPVGAFRLLEVERATTGEALELLDVPGMKPSLPGWDVLRRLGGEVTEVWALVDGEEVGPGEPLLLAGRFEKGGLFRVTLLPGRPEEQERLSVVGTKGRAELFFPAGRHGPAFLEWRDGAGEVIEEHWEAWAPWPALAEAFERAVAGGGGGPTWQDAVRALELDDAARRSLERRRASQLEYPEANEEVGFKGTMTLAGCVMLWGVLMLLVLSRWVPEAGYVILPLLVLFIALQLLRYAIPPREEKRKDGPGT